MKKNTCFIFVLLLAVICLSAFQYTAKNSFLNSTDTIAFIVPSNFPKPLYNLHITQKGFLLGKTLFYDPALSTDGSISCSSCHQASAAFANLGTALSTGINQCKGKRNAPPLFNLAWKKEFMWDGRIDAMLEVPVNAITNNCEMGTSIVHVLKTLNNSMEYKERFKEVYYKTNIQKDDLLNALGQFTSMLISARSKYDKVMRHEDDAVFSTVEQQGYLLFKQKCAVCHREPLFTDGSYRNNGLDEKYTDIGRDSLTHSRNDQAKFRVPTLRNIEITGPYMHDGRFRTLKQVLAHYSAGVKNHTNLDPVLKQNDRLGIELTDKEELQIISFLKTLTDVDFINDRRFNNN